MNKKKIPRGRAAGFTLVELAIVLVIIGLLVGGVLAGRDLINSATMNAQLTQLDQYNAAANTFRDKYGGLPGDLSINRATAPGFNINGCNGSFARRDGNGLIENPGGSIDNIQGYAEVELFWEDLGMSGLIPSQIPGGGAPSYGCTYAGPTATLTPGTAYVGNYLPQAKISDDNFIYVYAYMGQNWYGISAVSSIVYNNCMTSSPTIKVIYANNIDTKIDDGIATTGKTVAMYFTCSTTISMSPHVASAGSACYNPATNQYYTSINETRPNCGISIRLQ